MNSPLLYYILGFLMGLFTFWIYRNTARRLPKTGNGELRSRADIDLNTRTVDIEMNGPIEEAIEYMKLLSNSFMLATNTPKSLRKNIYDTANRIVGQYPEYEVYVDALMESLLRGEDSEEDVMLALKDILHVIKQKETQESQLV